MSAQLWFAPVKIGKGFRVGRDDLEIFRKEKPKSRWDDIWFELAKFNSSLTRCYTRGVGAVIVTDDYRFQVSSGYNGPPIGTRHPEERHPEKKKECPRIYYGYKSGEGRWICSCAHAEGNAICFAARHGRKTESTALYLYSDPSVLPCLDCAIDIIQAGINEVIVNSFIPYEKQKNAVDILELFREANVLVRKHLAIEVPQILGEKEQPTGGEK